MKPLSAQVFDVAPDAGRLVDAVQRLEADYQVLRAEYLNAQREGELLGLTKALALLEAGTREEIKTRIKRLIADRAWE